MIGLLQRVSAAAVTVQDEEIAHIGRGLLVLVGFRRGDRAERLDRFLERLLHFRVFADEQGRMNLALSQVAGDLLLVPQFTLAADTQSGHRPSFAPAAPSLEGSALFEQLIEKARAAWPATAAGRFGADMQVSLVNDGPVTFWLEVD
ncbi:MAG: D-aminoacyl-tRNA deacylase [Wenzhouxiangella sp.]